MRYLLACLLVFAACAQPQRGPVLPPLASVAVAGFICPQYDWELMAGVLPEEPVRVASGDLSALDVRLADQLGARGKTFVSGGTVRSCEKTVGADKERRRHETVAYWRQVAKCLNADYVLVPYVTGWRERDGGDYGIKVPASVTLDLYLIQAASGQVLRAHFEEEQLGLAENLLSGKRFVQRKGRWVTAEELAADGIAQALEELGL